MVVQWAPIINEVHETKRAELIPSSSILDIVMFLLYYTNKQIISPGSIL